MNAKKACDQRSNRLEDSFNAFVQGERIDSRTTTQLTLSEPRERERERERERGGGKRRDKSTLCPGGITNSGKHEAGEITCAYTLARVYA